MVIVVDEEFPQEEFVTATCEEFGGVDRARDEQAVFRGARRATHPSRVPATTTPLNLDPRVDTAASPTEEEPGHGQEHELMLGEGDTEVGCISVWVIREGVGGNCHRGLCLHYARAPSPSHRACHCSGVVSSRASGSQTRLVKYIGSQVSGS